MVTCQNAAPKPSLQPVLVPEALGDLLEPGVGLGHGFLPVRVDKAAGGGGEQTLGRSTAPTGPAGT